MENNWRAKAIELTRNWLDWVEEDSSEFNNCVGAMQEAMNLVFEATKKKCADNKYADMLQTDDGDFLAVVNIQAILNITKPNL